MFTNKPDVNEHINRPQQMIVWYMVFKVKLIKQAILTVLPRAHHNKISALPKQVESEDQNDCKQEFFNTIVAEGDSTNIIEMFRFGS